MDCGRAKIWALAEPIAAEFDLEVLEIELEGSGTRRVLRVYLDSPEPGQSVTLADCGSVSRRLSDALDAHAVLRGGYVLEVSSPGLNRPLRALRHFERAVGSHVRVRLVQARDGRRNVVGTLIECSGNHLVIRDDAGSVSCFPMAEVQRANLEYEFEGNARPRKRRR